MQFGALAQQRFERRHIARVILGLHIGMGKCRSALDDGLVLGGKSLIRFLVHIQRQLRAHFPKARVVVMLGDLVQTQLQIVIGADPLGRVNRAFFQRLVNLAAGNVLWNDTQTLQHAAGESTATELQTLEVRNRVDFLAVPAAHLHAGIAHGEVDDSNFSEVLTQKLQAVALVHPRCHLAAVQSEWNRAIKRVGGVFAEEIVRRRVGHLDGSIGHAVKHAKSRHQLARSMGGDRETSAREFSHFFGEHIAHAKQSVQRLGETGSTAPAQSGLRMNSGGNARREHTGQASVSDNRTTIHTMLLKC